MLDGGVMSSPSFAVSSSWGVDSRAYRRVLGPVGGIMRRSSWRVIPRSLRGVMGACWGELIVFSRGELRSNWGVRRTSARRIVSSCWRKV